MLLPGILEMNAQKPSRAALTLELQNIKTLIPGNTHYHEKTVMIHPESIIHFFSL